MAYALYVLISFLKTFVGREVWQKMRNTSANLIILLLDFQ